MMRGEICKIKRYKEKLCRVRKIMSCRFRKEINNGNVVQNIRMHLVWDEIGTCSNTEVEIDITDKSPFFIRQYHVKEEDKIY